MEKNVRPRFAFTPGEKRALTVLAALIILGLIALQVRRWQEQKNNQIVIINADTLDTTSASLPGQADQRSTDIKPSTPGNVFSPETGDNVHSGKIREPEKKPGPIRVNSATKEELMTLPGIGPVLAGRIIEYRRQHGPFRQAEDLLLVRGIGKVRLKNLLPYISTEL